MIYTYIIVDISMEYFADTLRDFAISVYDLDVFWRGFEIFCHDLGGSCDIVSC